MACAKNCNERTERSLGNVIFALPKNVKSGINFSEIKEKNILST